MPEFESNWTEFPLIHHVPFTSILLYCEPADLLSCRATCSTWHTWFSNSSTIWNKYWASLCASVPENKFDYRICELVEMPCEDESSALRLSFKLKRALMENPVHRGSVAREAMTQMENMMLEGLGPPVVFIRLKVNHPSVKKIVEEVLSRFLNCILLDKKDMLHEKVRFIQFQYMQQLNFVFVDFEQRLPEEEENDDGSMVLSGEENLEEALKLSLMSDNDQRGEKRKNESPAVESNKRPKLEVESESNCEADSINEEDDEDTSRSIYSYKKRCDPEFPTILELLSIDHPVIERMLIDKCQIDTSLVVPKFDDFLHHESLLSSDKFIVGCDADGKVSIVRPGAFSQDGDTVLGYVESPNVLGIMSGKPSVNFWAGKDIRKNWPEFSQQLDMIDETVANSSLMKAKNSKLNLPIVVHQNSKPLHYFLS